MEEEQSLSGIHNETPYTEEKVKEANPVFAAPFGSKFGNSSVDLDLKENHDTMRNEYRAWWDLPNSEEKTKLQEEFSQKYYGLSAQEVRENQRQAMAGTSMYLSLIHI